MKQRVIYVEKQKGTTIPGIAGPATAYLIEGMVVPQNCGGGRIASIWLEDGMLCFTKVDGEGNPMRNFGTKPMPQTQGKQKLLVADGAACPVQMVQGLLFDNTPAKEEPAKPAQNQQATNQGQRR